MSKRSRRRKAKEPGKPQPTSKTQASLPTQATTPVSPTSSQKPVTIPTTRARSPYWRVVWIAAILVVAAIIWIITNKPQDRPRMGIIEYSSDDPDAQLILEKDGQEISLPKGSKVSQQVEAGSYKFRLANPTEGLKLYPASTNLDPGGRSIVTVRRVAKTPPPLKQ